MALSSYKDLAAWIKLTDEPHVRENRRFLAKTFIEGDAELKAEINAKAREEARIHEARFLLVRVLARRKITTTATELARIYTCTNIETLRRWQDQAVEATTVAEALR